MKMQMMAAEVAVGAVKERQGQGQGQGQGQKQGQGQGPVLDPRCIGSPGLLAAGAFSRASWNSKFLVKGQTMFGALGLNSILAVPLFISSSFGSPFPMYLDPTKSSKSTLPQTELHDTSGPPKRLWSSEAVKTK